MIVLYSILGVILLVLLIALILPGKYTVEKTMEMNASAEKCYDMVADLNNYRDWNPWSKMEPDAQKTITGTPKTPGHSYEWVGKKIGHGKLTVKSVETNRSAVLDLEFFKPFKSKADDIWSFSQNGGKTTVNWKNTGPLPFPMARLMGPMITKNLDKQFVEGLNNIKQIVEK
jgi:hypothetical protein